MPGHAQRDLVDQRLPEFVRSAVRVSLAPLAHVDVAGQDHVDPDPVAAYPPNYPESPRSQPPTAPPASVNACVIARPIPLEPPVTIATCPSNRPTATRPLATMLSMSEEGDPPSTSAIIVDCRRTVV